MFGSKPCCFSDLRDFIEKLAGGDKLAFLARISKISSQTHAAEAAQVCLHKEVTSKTIQQLTFGSRTQG
jgi:hypothetical protein